MIIEDYKDSFLSEEPYNFKTLNADNEFIIINDFFYISIEDLDAFKRFSYNNPDISNAIKILVNEVQSNLKTFYTTIYNYLKLDYFNDVDDEYEEIKVFIKELDDCIDMFQIRRRNIYDTNDIKKYDPLKDIIAFQIFTCTYYGIIIEIYFNLDDTKMFLSLYDDNAVSNNYEVDIKNIEDIKKLSNFMANIFKMMILTTEEN